MSLLGAAILYGTLNGADLASTRYARAHGAVETNWQLDAPLYQQASIKAFETACMAVIDQTLLRDHRAMRWIGRGGVAAYTIKLVVGNISAAKKHRR